MIRVLVVDDSAFVRQALTRMLAAPPDIEVVGTAVDGKDGVDKVLELQPDVVTLDVKMPRLGGLEALQRIMERVPDARCCCSPRSPARAPTSRCAAWSWARWTSSTSPASRAT